MAILALTMGPSLGITMLPASFRVGEPGTITFEAVGAVGSVKWRIVSSSLPAEWDSSLTPSGTSATLDTAEAEVFGTFMVTIIASDENRQPVTRTFTIFVAPAPVTIASPPGEYSWTVGTPVTETLAISGGTGVYVSAEVPSLPAGVTVGIVGDDLTFSGTPTTVTASTSTTAKVTDSDGAQGIVGIDYKVTNPPKILAVGGFTTVDGNSCNRIVRLTPEGAFDIAPPGYATAFRGLAADTGGRYIIGRTGVERYLADGTLDPSFTNPGSTGVVNVVLPLPDGRYAIGGTFTAIGGVSRTRLAILHADGTLDTSFVPPSIPTSVNAIALDSAGRLLIGGGFSNIGGTACQGIARMLMTGAHDTSFVSPFSSGTVNAVAIQSDGRIIVAGSSGADLRVTRLLANGTHDPAWTYVSVSRICNALALDEADGVVYCGSSNTLFLRRHFLTNGAIDSTFTPTFNGAVDSVAIQPDKKIVVGHTRDISAGNSSVRRLNADGTTDWLSPAFNGDVYRVALQVSS